MIIERAKQTVVDFQLREAAKKFDVALPLKGL